MKVTPELWIKRSADHINEIRHILNCMLIIHELPGGASESSPLPPLPPACSTQRFVPLPPPPPPPAVGRSLPLSGGAGAAAEHAFVQPPPPPPPPACERCGAPTAPRLKVCAGCELYVAISETLRTADRRADWRHGIQEALHNYRARTSITDERGDPVLLAGNGERSYTSPRTALPIENNSSDDTSTAPDEASLDELPLHLDACHSCAMRKVRIDDNGPDFSERYLNKRRRAYHAQHTGMIPPQGRWRYGLNELGGEECSLCGHRASAEQLQS